ncbi:hypothetical protein CLLI_28100 [Clostridium liquoris]|uniref:Glycine transporter domain-containing protein n=1 Tax=Clostridium liquoris TaxID=1289519 RepID=A0A2T0B036_9CLOT|nr:trimeric intracellular cation channel family protein [Clostridium liquoris]PRR76876.1 hypothetical protein CLLI_28100 [Clostridium liquoris]
MGLMHVFEIIGTVAFAISGAMVGISKEMDLFGTIFLAITTAVGGGVFRDLIIGITPPTAFVNPYFCVISIVSALIVFIFYNKLNKLNNIIQISDAIGLGAFTAIGCNVAINHNFTGTFIIVSLGLFTGVGGGILRDVFAQEIPFVFTKEIYAVASILGAITLIYARKIFDGYTASYICFFTTFIIRVLSIKCGLHLPKVRSEKEKSKFTL